MWVPGIITLRPEVLIYVLNLAVVVSLLCSASLLAVRACRKRSAPLRYNLLASSLTLTLLCPWAAWIGQHHGAGFFEVSVSGRAPEAGSAESGPSPWMHVTDDLTGQPSQYQGSQTPGFHLAETRPKNAAPDATPEDRAGLPATPRPVGGSRLALTWWQLTGTLAVYAWALGVGVGALRLGSGYRAVARMRRSMRPLLDSRLAVLAGEVSEALRLKEPPPILASGQVSVPISLGVWQPVVILPQDMAREMENSQLAAVLLHEMAHIARRDHLTGLIERLAVILFWWNPLVRRLSNRVSELREEICDNHVLSVQGGGEPLARVLVDMADRATIGPRLPVTVGINGPDLDGLGKRITRLIEKEPNMATQINRVGSAFIFLFGLATLLGIASVGSLQAFQQDADQPAGQGQDEERASEGDSGAQGTGVLGLLSGFDDVQKRSAQRNEPAAKKNSSERRGKNRSEQSGKAGLKAVYQTDFRKQKFDHGTLIPYGYKTLYGLQLLKPEARGLRVIIPYHQGAHKPSIGLFTLLKIEGDFEITATCELITSEPPKTGAVAGAGLYVMAEETLHSAVLRRGVRPNGDHVYFANATIRGDDGKPGWQIKYSPAEDRTGQLRLRRRGTTLEFLVAEEKSDQFRKLHEVEFGQETIGIIRLEATTDGSPTSVEALWKDLTIRAEELKRANVPLFGTGLLTAQNETTSSGPGAAPRTYVDSIYRAAPWTGIRLFEPFEGHLTLDWKPVRPDPTHVSLTKNPGRLTITTQPGGMWEDTGREAKNLYLVRTPMAQGGDFVLTTCIESFRPAMKWQQAGLLIYDDDDNYLKCAMEAGDGNPRLALVRESDGEAESEIDQTGVETEKVWIRIIKRGKTYERAYSIDGRRFISAGEADWGDGIPKRIGLFAKNGTGSETEIDAAFDFFEVRSLTPEEKVPTSGSVSETAPAADEDPT